MSKKLIFIIIGVILFLGAGVFLFISIRSAPANPPPGLTPATLPLASSTNPTPTPISGGNQNTKYLAFQLFTSSAITDSFVSNNQLARPLSKKEIISFVDSLIQEIGTTGDANHKLAFMPGPLSLDFTDDDMSQLIRDSFAIAEEKDIAVGFHIDDSMYWNRRKDLWQNPKNVEWADWKGTTHPHRYVDWITNATLAPQMCYNSPIIQEEISRIAKNVIGDEVTKGIAHLKTIHKEYLFAGIIAGWETHLGDYSVYAKVDKEMASRMERDGSPKVKIGYCALTNNGYSAKNPPKDIDFELAKVVQDFTAFWAKQFYDIGIPKEKIFTHIAYDENIDQIPLDKLSRVLGG